MITAQMLHEAYSQAYDEVVRVPMAKAGLSAAPSMSWQTICDEHHKRDKQSYERMAEILNERLESDDDAATSITQV